MAEERGALAGSPLERGAERFRLLATATAEGDAADSDQTGSKERE